jgi:7-keto-8-aminopelargonate synthetase-like enzyme
MNAIRPGWSARPDGVSPNCSIYGGKWISSPVPSGKAFGGAIGGFTTGRKEIIELLRQRSRPYLFSNSLPPAVVGAGIRMFDMMDETTELQDRLHRNTEYFMEKMKAAGI